MKRLLIIALSVLLLIIVGFVVWNSQLLTSNSNMRTKPNAGKTPVHIYHIDEYGIDISHHQSDSIWQYFDGNTLNITHVTSWIKRRHIIPGKRIPISFIYIKASQSSGFKDPACKAHLREARKRGIKAGYYHFYSINATPEAQLKNFSSQLDKAKTSLPPAIDFEHISEHMKSEKQKKEVYNDFKRFYDMVKKRYKVEPVVYTNQPEYEMFFKDKNFKLWMPGLSKDKRRVISQFCYVFLDKRIPIDLDVKTK